MALPLAYSYKGEQVRAMQFTLVAKIGKNWQQVDQPCNFPGPEPGLYVDLQQIHSICDLLEHDGGGWVLQTKKYGISNDTGQQRDMQVEF